MRPDRTVQASIFERFAGHEIGRELQAMSAWLDDHRALLGLVAADLCRHGVKQTGRQGLPAAAVLRCARLKPYRQLSYHELAFHLEASASFRAFARLPWARSPKKSVLHQTIGALRAETWEAINRALLAGAAEAKLERGTVVRLDSTVTAAPVHAPSDSSLLWDAVRVLTRLLKQARALGAGLAVNGAITGGRPRGAPGTSSPPAGGPGGRSSTASCSRSPGRPWPGWVRRRCSWPPRPTRRRHSGRPGCATIGR